MAATASFSILIDSGDPKNLYIYTRFQGNSEKKISRQVAAILIIGGKLKF